MAFLPGWLQSTDAAPNDGFATAIVPVDSTEHFTAFAANDNLCKAVVAAVGALFAIGTGLDYSPAYQLFLHPQEDVLRNNCFVVAFHIVLRNNAIVLHSGFIQKVCGVGLLKKGITDVFSFRRILLMVLVHHFVLPAPVRMPSASRPFAIRSIE